MIDHSDATIFREGSPLTGVPSGFMRPFSQPFWLGYAVTSIRVSLPKIRGFGFDVLYGGIRRLTQYA